MAMVQKKKGGNWYIVYRVNGKQVWSSTGTNDKKLANSIEDTVRKQNSENKLRRKMAELLGEKTPEPVNSILPPKAKRLKLDKFIQTVEKYRVISIYLKRAWNRFAATLPQSVVYADQISADMAFDYLQSNYGDQSGKAWNNNKTYLNSLFRVILIDANLSESPFARVIQRRDEGQHQRPFTEKECAKIITAANEPWMSACIIAYHTGLRQKDCFALKWTDIQDDVITIRPAKTARFGKAVQVPVHQQLIDHLATLPRHNDRVLGFSNIQCHNSGSFTLAFGKLLATLKINDNESGIVCFNSFRNTFITRCDAAKIPRHATRGIVGHKDDLQTDLYSHDISGAKEILRLPAGNFKIIPHNTTKG
jgi:integrase